ncbi:MAG TPA: hypothetical protein VMC61_03485 [Methanocella sp.]|nr:hypothetical protein [Methanocella sp.]
MSEREHKRGHRGSKQSREEYAMRRRKSPTCGHIDQEEKPVKGPHGEKSFRV